MNVILGILHSVSHRVIVSFDASYIDNRIELSNERKIEKENRNICKVRFRVFTVTGRPKFGFIHRVR